MSEKVITHSILRCSEASLLRHGAGPGGDGRVRIQQLVRLAGIYAASPVQISHLPCLLTSLYLFLLPFFSGTNMVILQSHHFWGFFFKKKEINFMDVGINSHWEVLEATRPIGIVHVVERMPNQSPLTSSIHHNESSSCRHNLTVSLYLPQRLHSNPPSAGLGAVSYYAPLRLFFFSLVPV